MTDGSQGRSTDGSQGRSTDGSQGRSTDGSQGRSTDGSQGREGRPQLLVLSGPSGVGKSTVMRELRAHHPEIWLSVSVTTRFPRPGEIDGVQYHFVSDADFDALIAEHGLLEWATFAGHRYGTPRAPVEERLAEGIPVLLEIELQGARQIRKLMPEALLVFLAPPTWDELVRRLAGRGTEPPDVIERRLATAREELAAEEEFDVTLVNTSVQDVVTRLVTLLEAGVAGER